MGNGTIGLDQQWNTVTINKAFRRVSCSSERSDGNKWGDGMRIVKIVLLTIQAIFLGVLLGCGGKSKWFHDRADDYVNAESHPRLKIPAKMDTERFSEEYQIPDLNHKAKATR